MTDSRRKKFFLFFLVVLFYFSWFISFFLSSIFSFFDRLYDSRSSVYGCEVFMARSDVGSVCLPTPPLTYISALKSHVSEKHGLAVGWMGSFENVFLVPLFFIQYFKFSVAFLLEIYWTFQSGTHSAGKQ